MKHKKTKNILKPLPAEVKNDNTIKTIQSAQNIQEIAKNILTKDEKEAFKDDLINWLAKHTLSTIIVAILTISTIIGGAFTTFLYLERDRTDLKLENQTLKTQIDILKYQNQDCQKQLQSQDIILQKLNKK